MHELNLRFFILARNMQLFKMIYSFFLNLSFKNFQCANALFRKRNNCFFWKESKKLCFNLMLLNNSNWNWKLKLNFNLLFLYSKNDFNLLGIKLLFNNFNLMFFLPSVLTFAFICTKKKGQKKDIKKTL